MVMAHDDGDGGDAYGDDDRQVCGASARHSKMAFTASQYACSEHPPETLSLRRKGPATKAHKVSSLNPIKPCSLNTKASGLPPAPGVKVWYYSYGIMPQNPILIIEAPIYGLQGLKVRTGAVSATVEV